MACRGCAVSTAIEDSIDFNTMSNDSTLAMCALRRHRLDRTFETIEDVRFARRDELESLVVLVAADFTLAHRGALDRP